MFYCKDDLSLTMYSTRDERRMRWLLAGDVERRVKRDTLPDDKPKLSWHHGHDVVIHHDPQMCR
jgi:hypothetical protein